MRSRATSKTVGLRPLWIRCSFDRELPFVPSRITVPSRCLSPRRCAVPALLAHAVVRPMSSATRCQALCSDSAVRLTGR